MVLSNECGQPHIQGVIMGLEEKILRSYIGGSVRTLVIARVNRDRREMKEWAKIVGMDFHANEFTLHITDHQKWDDRRYNWEKTSRLTLVVNSYDVIGHKFGHYGRYCIKYLLSDGNEVWMTLCPGSENDPKPW